MCVAKSVARQDSGLQFVCSLFSTVWGKRSGRMVAIDGDCLAELMIEFNLGVTLEQTDEIKRIDSDFFEE